MNGRVRSLFHVLAVVGVLLSAAPARKLYLPRSPEPPKTLAAAPDKKLPVEKKKRPPLTIAEALPQIAGPRNVHAAASLASAKSAGAVDSGWRSAPGGGEFPDYFFADYLTFARDTAWLRVLPARFSGEPVVFLAQTCIRPNAPPIV